MGKEQDEAKALNKELHKSINKPLTDKIHEIWVFIQKLVAAVFAVGVGGSGILAEVHATVMHSGLYRDAVIVSGVCAGLTGLALLYVALMKVGK